MSSSIRFCKRLLVVGTSATLALALVAMALATIALRADWQVPSRRDLATPSVLTDRGGQVITRFTSQQDRQVVSLARISREAQLAVIASEDVRFYEHTGVDPVSLLRAVYRNVRTGGIEQGGSTLTQQYVKNALTGVGSERTITRKVREAVVSIALERRSNREAGGARAGKDRILEDYLNTVYFGESAYGIEAAAQEFFGIEARSLSAGQAALLAQALPAPSIRNARVDPEGARARADRILRIMLQHGFIDQEAHDSAVGVEVQTLPATPVTIEHPFFVEYVRKQVIAEFGEDALLTAGLEIRSTLDLEVQRALEDSVAEVLDGVRDDPENGDVDAAAVAIDPRSGDILGIYGGRDFTTQQLDLATQGRRQNGSTFKPFGFIAALEAGRSPDGFVPSPSRQTIQPSDCTGAGTTPLLGEPWGPVTGPGGSMRLREALIRSVNTAFQRLSCDLGPSAIVDVAERLGVRNQIDRVPAVGLGGSRFGASVLDMASAFATLANDGVHCPARSILRIRDGSGAELPPLREVTIVPDMDVRSRVPSDEELSRRPEGLAERDTGRCFGALSPDVARATTETLQQVVLRTTGRRAQLDRPTAGKTGTTNDETDAWFVGYTPDIAIAVWVGHTEAATPLRNVAGFARVQGGTLPAMIFRIAAERILENVPPTDFPTPGEGIKAGRVPAPARTDPATEPTAEASTAEPDGEPSDPPTTEPDESPSPSGPPCIIVLGSCG